MIRLALALLLTCNLGCASADQLFAPKGTRGTEAKREKSSSNETSKKPAAASSNARSGPSDECRQIERYAGAGEHKLAVDDYRTLQRAGKSCPETIVEQVEESQIVLRRADQLATEGLEARDRGDLIEARRRFGEALAGYPKYYWVQKLLRDVSEDPGGEVALAEARQAQEAGEIAEAVRLTHDAISHSEGSHSSFTVVEFASQLGLQLFNAGELITARNLWEAALTLDPANETLLEYRRQVDNRLSNLEEIKQQGR